MEDTELDLLLAYPLIWKRLEDGKAIYRGSMHVNDEDIKIQLAETSDDNFKLTLPDNLKNFEDEFDDIITKIHPKNIIIVLNQLSSFIGTKMPAPQLVYHCDVYRHVLYEYTDFTNFYLNLKSCCLAQDLGKINISTLDECGREHHIEVSVNFEDKHTFRITTYDLPQDSDQFKKSASLRDVYQQFLETVDTFQGFFDTVDVFDRNCWVLDPEKPQRSCTYRRIWLGENFSTIITFDPFDMSKLPEIKFLGPERLIDKYRLTLNAQIGDWEPENGIFSEVLKLLGLESFPQRPALEDHGPELLLESGDCSICFSHRLDNKLPEVVCKNKSCENCYHVECLYEWLMTVNASKFFSEVVGLCPNCEKNISCPIPK